MALSASNLRIAETEEVPTFGEEAAGRLIAAEQREQKATAAVFLALKALSQRSLVALAAIEHLLLALSVFAIWLRVIATPTELQLIGVGGYAAFVLALIFMRRK